MLPQNKPDRIRILFDGLRVVAEGARVHPQGFRRRAHTVRVDACWKRTPKCLTSPLTGRSMGNRDATS